MTTTTHPGYWTRIIDKEIQGLREIPLWGAAPNFPIEPLCERLRTDLSIGDFQISITKQESIQTGSYVLGSDVDVRSFSLNPIEGILTWVFPKSSMAPLTTVLLKGPESKDLSDKSFQEGFYQYLILEVCNHLEELGVYPDLHIQLCERQEKPDLSGFCFDIELHILGKLFSGKLFLPANFEKSFREHFTKNTKEHRELNFSSQKNIDVLLRLVVGNTLLSQGDWASASVGDFLILDRCLYNPEDHKGLCDLYWNETPLFNVNLKKQSLKILDYAVCHGDTHNMDIEIPEHFSDDDEFSEGMPTAPEENDSSHLTDEDAVTEEETQETMESDEEHEHDEPTILHTDQSPLLTAKDILFPIVVELDRISMSLEKLLQLAPGNVLDITAHPEQGVSLTVHGKKIARGEIIKVGEIFGVKILEIGKDAL